MLILDARDPGIYAVGAHALMINCPHCQTTNHPKNAVCETCGAPLVADPALEGDPFVGRQLGGRFTLQAIVGSGEIGMVYRGVDSRTGAAVAVKLVHPDVAATHGDELLRSASMVAQLRHAKIAQVLAAAREPDGTSYIVIEFVDGKTLKTLLENTGPLGPRRAADILFQLCSALAPIHRAGRPHANLKPENVFLVDSEKDDFVKIVDVGSPDLFGVRETLSGKIVIGSPKFFSPEQALGQRVGLASDQFTLGVIGYQLLTGALPFFGATPDQLLASIAQGRPTPVTERVSGFTTIPEKLVHTIHRCLDKDPKARYPDLRGLATDLAAVIKSTPADPAPPPRPKKKKGFGAGLDVSTRIADPGALDNLFDDDDDADRTKLRDLPNETLEAMLTGEGTAEPTLTGSATPAMPAKPPTQNDMQNIPEPLAVTGMLGSDDLASALADAVAGVETGAPRAPTHTTPGGPRPPSGGGLGDDLMAALNSAAAEVGASPGFGADAPLTPSPGGGGFDPFGTADDVPGVQTPAAPEPLGGGPAALRPRASLPPGEMSNAILDALDDAVSSEDSGLKKLGASAASPLATAADFAALSPIALEAARVQEGGAPVTGKRTTIPPVTSAAAKGNRPAATALLLLALLTLAGGGAWWWMQQQAAVDADAQAETDRLRKARRAKARAAAKAAAADRVVTARLESTPQGARVFRGEIELGVTPLDVQIKGVDVIAYDLKFGGYAPTTQEIDPNRVNPKAEKPPVYMVALEVDPDAPPPPPAPAVEPEKPGPGKAPAPTPAVAPKPEKPAAVAAPTAPAKAAKPKPRRPKRQKKKKKRKKSDIKDPFAD